MGAPEERKALDKAVEAARKVVFGQRQSIRRPQQPSPQVSPQEERRGQT